MRSARSAHGLGSCGMRNPLMIWQSEHAQLKHAHIGIRSWLDNEQVIIPAIISGCIIAFSFSLFFSLVSSIDSNPQLLELFLLFSVPCRHIMTRLCSM